MDPTKTDPHHAKSVELCNSLLADAVELQTQAKHAEWNGKDDSTSRLRALFGAISAHAIDGAAANLIQVPL